MRTLEESESEYNRKRKGTSWNQINSVDIGDS
jgi:hypothetical protein